MATWYVCKSGNDSNGGTSYEDAFLTIGRAVSASASGDTIIVGSGVYQESIDLVGKNNITFEGDKYVILDGNNKSLTYGIYSSNNGEFYYVYIKNFIIQNFTCGIAYRKLYYHNITITNCTHAYYPRGYSNSNLGVLTSDSWMAIYNCSYALSGTIYDANTGNIIAPISATNPIKNITVANCTYGIYCPGTNGRLNAGSSTFLKNIFYNCNYILWQTVTASSSQAGDYIVYHPFDSNHKIVCGNGSQVFTSFSSWKSTVGANTYSTDADPKLIQPDIGLLGLDTGSSALDSDLVTKKSGIFNLSVGISNVVNKSIWDACILTNVEKDSKGYFRLKPDATVGTIRTPVINVTGYDVKSISLAESISYPTNVIDYNNTDSKPNRLTFRYRYSNTPFGVNDETPTWNETEGISDLNLQCNYLQLEITLRKDGVAG